MNVYVTPVDWHSHRQALQHVRERVFIEEQGVPREIEWDGEDEACSHFLALTEAGQPVGCARLMPGGQIGRMAVLSDHRGTGLGRELLDAAIDEAKRQGLTRVHLHAQVDAVGFYRKAGFLPQGGEFMEAGIRHQAMTLALPMPFQAPADVPRPAVREETSERTDAPDSRLTRHRGESDCLSGLVEALAYPRRHLMILSHQLDHALFDAPALVDAISRFARSSPSTDVRILITDSSAIVSRGHRLVELARRLGSRIAIQRIAEEVPVNDESFVTWDGLGFFVLPDFRDYTALADPYDPVQAKHLQEAFDYYWARSAPDPELRTLSL